MKSNFRRFIQPPDLGSGELNRRARLLTTILIFLLAFTLVLGAIYWLFGNWLGRLFVVLAVCVEFLSFLILKSGRLRPAGGILIYLLWAVLMLTILLQDGTGGPSALGQLLLIFLGGILISVRFSALLTALTLIGNYGAFLLEMNGPLLYGDLQLTTTGNWVFQSAYILLAFALMLLLGRSIRQSLDDVQDREQLLKEHVSELRKAQAQLEISEARYLAILQDQSDLIGRYKPDGKFIFVNSAYARYFGFDPDKATGMSVWTQVPAEDAEALKAKIASLSPAQPVSVTQNVNRRADGELRWVEWADRGIFDEQGKLIEVQAVGRDVHEENRLRKQLEDNLVLMENQAMSDPLTSLLNRRAIMEHAEAEWQRAQREHRPLSLVVMDVDNLKEINDTHGHLVGDRALRQLADSMHGGMRRYDWVGRWGGDEFLLVLPGTGLEDARDVAERLRLHFKQKKLEVKGNHPIELRVSLGVASQIGTDHGSDGLQSILARADHALYRAKQSGRDQVAVDS